MASLDTSMYRQNPLKSVADYEDEYARRDLQRQQLQQNALALQTGRMKAEEYTRGMNEQGQIRNLLSATKTPEEAINVLRSSGIGSALSHADTIEKNLVARRAQESTTNKTNSAITTEQHKLLQEIVSVINQSPTQATAMAMLDRWEGVTKTSAGEYRQLFASVGEDPEKLKQLASGVAIQAEKLLPKTSSEDLGGSRGFFKTDPITGRITSMGETPKSQSPDNLATNDRMAAEGALNRGVTMRGQNMTADRETKDDADPGKYTQVVIDPERGPLLVDRKTGTYSEVTGAGGAKIPGKNISDAKKLESKLGEAITMARELIPNATGSGAGSLVDTATRFVGKSTEGDDAATQLETLAGWMTSNVPRMQGPQSDKDTLLYRQMAAQVGDRTKTRTARLKALTTLEELQKKYAAAAGASDAPVQVKSDSDYHALKPGTRFVTPDGKTGTKK